MSVAYSLDLRQRAIDLVNSGKKVKAVAKLLNIGQSPIYVWLRKIKSGGELAAKSNWQKGHSHKITDLEKFKKFIDENSDLTLDQLAEKWGGVKRSSIQRAIKKIGYSKKKDFWFQRTKRSRKTKI